MYAILDLESTGGKYNEEGITEIAIFRHDGEKIVDQFSCLVNPERKIQPFVVKLTGINNAMLRHAPKFYEVAKRVVEITEGCVIVAHNAKFDYRLLQTEFNRLGYDFQRKSLCTIALSRQLIPGMPSYSLGKLVKNLGIPLTDRHRAIGDAKATVKLFEVLLAKDTKKNIVQNTVKHQPKNNSNKALIHLIEDMPSKTGVYYIFDDKGVIIYIGKSRNIKKRLNQHFTKPNPKSKQIQREVSTVSYDLTGNELIALLKENEAIKKIRPKYNVALKRSIFEYGLYSFYDTNNYLNLILKKTDRKDEPITTFGNLSQAKKALQKMVDRFELCPKLAGLYHTSGACFDYTIKHCNGACTGKELPELYNARVGQLIDRYSFKNKNMLLLGPGRTPSEKSALLIENGVFKGMTYYGLNLQINTPDIIRNLITPMNDDRDARHIIQSYLRKKNPFKIVRF